MRENKNFLAMIGGRKMENKIKNCEKSRLNALCIQEKFAYDMFKSAKSDKEKNFITMS